MKKNIFIKSLIALVFLGALSACSDMLNEEDLKTNPNSPSDASLDNILIGVLIGVGEQHEDTEVRIASLWSGQLAGRSRQHQTFGVYTVSSSTFGWFNQYNIIANARIGEAKADELGNSIVKGILQVSEAMVFAKLTALYGDIPFTQVANDEFPTPIYDDQVTVVYPGIISLLDAAIANLNAGTGGTFSDFMGGGSADAWIAAANTLKARLYLHLGQNADAIAAAQDGIADVSGDLLMYHGTSQTFDQNLNYDFFYNNRSGDTDFDAPSIFGTVMQSLNNEKTDNTALDYHIHNNAGEGDFPNTNDGMFIVDAPHPIVTHFENQLILAEASLRDGDAATALDALNDVRAELATGNIYGLTINADTQALGLLYDAYADVDFATDADLLAEILKQKYVLLIMQYENWNHTRRLEGLGELDVLGLESTNAPTDNRLPGRFPYPQGEINTNPNTPPVGDDEQYNKLAIFQ
jgi:hypothetical protein